MRASCLQPGKLKTFQPFFTYVLKFGKNLKLLTADLYDPCFLPNAVTITP